MSFPFSEVFMCFVSGEKNSNKFYSMKPLPDGTWEASWGRVGTEGKRIGARSCIYQGWQWCEKYAEKTRKGYEDISESYFWVDEEEDEKTAAADKPKQKKRSVAQDALALMKMLAGYAHMFFTSNYTLESNHINSKMIEKGEECLADLSRDMERLAKLDEDDTAGRQHVLELFNDDLRHLFAQIPRAMSCTWNFFARTTKDFQSIYDRENEYLETLRGIVEVKKKTPKEKPAETDTKSADDVEEEVIERYGLDIRKVDASEEKEIRRLMGSDARSYSRAWKIVNATTEKPFDEYSKKVGNTRLLFHGSASRNFHSIVCQGLKLNPGRNVQITGKMFGYGLYFSDECGKSMGYTDIQGSRWRGGSDEKGYLAIYEVAMGKPLDVHVYNNYGSYTQKDMERNGTDSLFAHKGSMLYRNEMIVYREDALTIRYLIEIE